MEKFRAKATLEAFVLNGNLIGSSYSIGEDMRILMAGVFLGISMIGAAHTIDLSGSSHPTSRHQLLDPAVILPKKGVILSRMLDNRVITRGFDPITELSTFPLIFVVHDLDLLMLQSINEQTRYTLRSNDRRGKANGNYPLIMELELNGHRRWMTVRHLPREHIALENQGKLLKYNKNIDL